MCLLFSLQVADDKYKTFAENNAFLRKVQYPSRGLMYDRSRRPDNTGRVPHRACLPRARCRARWPPPENNAFLRKVQYPSRGLMYDRNGELVVYNQPAYDVMRLRPDFGAMSYAPSS